jgi:NTP pyrophosphatase (non-canonical NTP hydrolase)
MDQLTNRRADSYTPFAPQSPNIITGNVYRACPFERDGLYYLDPSGDGIRQVKTVTDYQRFAQEGWKEPHGTYAASGRFSKKLDEEVGESLEADTIFMASVQDPESPEALELLSELGDVLWCATALAANSSVDINEELKVLLAEYKRKMINYKSNSARLVFGATESIYPDFGYDPVRLPWRALARNLTRVRGVTLSSISELVAPGSGFEPLPSCWMRLPDDEPFWDMEQHIDYGIRFAAQTMKSIADQQYGYGETESDGVIVCNYDDKSHSQGHLAASIYLEVAYVASHRLGLTLEDVVAKNMDKLNARIVAGRVDKTDGERDTSLL